MYEQHFGLSAKPFQLSPDAGFFYPSAEHTKALAFLRYGLSQEDGFIVITGNVGAGKTTLVRTLLDELGDERSVATIVTSNLGEHDLLQMVAKNFGLDHRSSSKADILQDLEAYFITQAKAGRSILLIVDEAQNIPDRSIEELRMLSNFNLDGKPLLQIFLLGQQEFRTTLLSKGFEQLRQRVIATHHLKPLSEDETKHYIEHRLEVAGWRGNPAFTNKAHRLIFRATEGIPRRINNMCDRILLYAHIEDQRIIDRSVVKRVSDEIGAEFLGWSNPGDLDDSTTQRVFDHPDFALEADEVHKPPMLTRVAELEDTLESLGDELRPEIHVIRKELSLLRAMMRDVSRKLMYPNRLPKRANSFVSLKASEASN